MLTLTTPQQQYLTVLAYVDLVCATTELGELLEAVEQFDGTTEAKQFVSRKLSAVINALATSPVSWAGKAVASPADSLRALFGSYLHLGAEGVFVWTPSEDRHVETSWADVSHAVESAVRVLRIALGQTDPAMMEDASVKAVLEPLAKDLGKPSSASHAPMCFALLEAAGLDFGPLTSTKGVASLAAQIETLVSGVGSDNGVRAHALCEGVRFSDVFVRPEQSRGDSPARSVHEIVDGPMPFRIDCALPFCEEPVMTPEAAKAYDVLRRFLAAQWGIDSEEWRFITEWAGVAMLGQASRYHRILAIKGPKGTGKSSLVELIAALFPEDTVTPSRPSAWSGRFGNAWELEGKLLAYDTEVPSNLRGSAAAIKQVAVGEMLDCEIKFVAGHRKVRPRCGVLWATNHTPDFGEDADPMTDRLVLLETTGRSMRGSSERIENLKDAVAAYRPYFVRLAVKAALEVFERGGYSIPSSSDDAVENMREESSPVSGWLRYVGATPSSEVEDRKCRTELYRHYVDFAGTKAVSDRKFFASLREEGYRDAQSGKLRYFGMKLSRPLTDDGDSFAAIKE